MILLIPNLTITITIIIPILTTHPTPSNTITHQFQNRSTIISTMILILKLANTLILMMHPLRWNTIVILLILTLTIVLIIITITYLTVIQKTLLTLIQPIIMKIILSHIQNPKITVHHILKNTFPI